MSNQTQMPSAVASTRSGYVALVGRPNAGKSTLLNRLIGEKLSIVTPKAQTTWQRVTGIRTSGNTQTVFLDTPGLLEVRDLHQKSMLYEAHEALREADLVVIVVDASQGPVGEQESEIIREALDLSKAPRLLVANQADRAKREDIDRVLIWGRETLNAEVLPLSALKGHGVDELIRQIDERLPVGPFLYPEDEIASESVRFFVQEFIRETVFEQFHKEVPYALFAQIEEFREGQDPVYIGAHVYVERNSQKRIVVGEKGTAIRELGRVARKKIETFLQRPVYLDLWVKVLPNWRRRRGDLNRLGVRVPEEHG
jgi:GTPase